MRQSALVALNRRHPCHSVLRRRQGGREAKVDKERARGEERGGREREREETDRDRLDRWIDTER